MNTPRFEGPFKWSALREQLMSLCEDIQSIKKVAGRNVTIDEYRGKGKVINVASDASRRGGGGAGATGACCYDDGTCDDLTEADCTEAGGNWQGSDTTCEDAGVCVGACCEGDDGTTCVDNSTPDSCAADGGTWMDFGTSCSDTPSPCMVECSCGFAAFDGSGRTFLTMTVHMINQCGDCDWTTTWTYNPNNCTYSGDNQCGGWYAGPAGEDCGGNLPPCIPPILNVDVLSQTATYLSVRSRSNPCPDPDYRDTAQATLSDECFAPPP